MLPEETVITFSKTKIFLLILASLAFVGGGLWMVFLDTLLTETHHRFNHAWLMQGAGWVMIVFFGFCGVAAMRRLFNKKPALIFNAAGITDNSSSLAAGLVPWRDITGFGIYESHKQRILIVQVKNPDEYIETGSAMKRSLKRTNFRMCGSPVAITASSLSINFDELQRISSEYFARYHQA
ncbi:hypothetical protein SAMN05192560_0583 [Methylobacillus rhizosphaerae]|uniref:Uncharacterized protein n=1 Tax=Methylobacillus rhizosphaerae TaxID=551994 RepID=A0A238YHF2_9PROT|nr:STM3941 family protein [Methylobacillus rhizosphaerae]SNR70218.1 hypothetical protein SAMN05192560_0583 [Methylobacillus rhizosphaerae]